MGDLHRCQLAGDPAEAGSRLSGSSSWNSSLEKREPDRGLIGFVCECAAVGCTTRVEATLAEYQIARAQPTRFLVAPGHMDPDYERVVTTNERFAIVEKLGVAGELATDEAD